MSVEKKQVSNTSLSNTSSATDSATGKLHCQRTRCRSCPKLVDGFFPHRFFFLSTGTKRFWCKTKMKINIRHGPGLKPQMESILSFAAEWVSVKEMKALRGACVLTSMRARERQHEELLSDLDNQVWKELSDDWQRYLLEKEKSSAL